MRYLKLKIRKYEFISYRYTHSKTKIRFTLEIVTILNYLGLRHYLGLRNYSYIDESI